jgi:uncharacterized protein (DUF433 family)
MAKVIRQIVVQDNLTGTMNDVPKRFIVQYYDDVENSDLQQIIVYESDLTAEQKTTYDNFITLCNTKIA